MTYCGTSKASNLTMENVPWHEEVISFVKELADLLPDYEIASEHEHSNCVLLAHRKVMHNSQAVLCCGCRSLSERPRISPVYVFLTIGDIAPSYSICIRSVFWNEPVGHCYSGKLCTCACYFAISISLYVTSGGSTNRCS